MIEFQSISISAAKVEDTVEGLSPAKLYEMIYASRLEVGMRRIAFLLFCCVVSSVSTALADDVAVEKYRSYLPQDIASLPKDAREQIPMMYLNAAELYMSPQGEVVVAGWLNQLMYPGVGDYNAAILSFQRDLGEKPTGKLTVWQIHQLYYRAGMMGVQELIVPFPVSSSKSDSYALVKGTMVIVDEKIYNPINYQRLSCFKPSGYCRLDEVSIELPNDKSWGFKSSVYLADTLFYKITDWGVDTIKATYEGDGSQCRSTSMDLNFATKEFYLITTNLDKDCEALGVKIERLKKPRISQIVDGEKVIRAEYEAIREKQKSFVSSEFLSRVKPADEKTDLKSQN